MKDTYNLLADGIVKLLRVLAAVSFRESVLRVQHQGRGVVSKAQRKLLGEIVADHLELARQAWAELPEDSFQSIVDAGADADAADDGVIQSTMVESARRSYLVSPSAGSNQ